jgi:hypothetical protein
LTTKELLGENVFAALGSALTTTETSLVLTGEVTALLTEKATLVCVPASVAVN